MTAPIIGTIACVVLSLASIGFGWNLRAWTAALQTRFSPQATCAVYLVGALLSFGAVVTCLMLVWLRAG